jgi:hypothetical protein
VDGVGFGFLGLGCFLQSLTLVQMLLVLLGVLNVVLLYFRVIDLLLVESVEF